MHVSGPNYYDFQQCNAMTQLIFSGSFSGYWSMVENVCMCVFEWITINRLVLNYCQSSNFMQLYGLTLQFLHCTYLCVCLCVHAVPL